MSRSQNGWSVIDHDGCTDRAVLGVEFPNGWRRGDVDVIFAYLIGRLHREVEALDKGGCWGWFVKPIEGSATISNHASGTAIDYNAPAHPMGSRNTYSAAKRSKIRAILADLEGVVRWGGDYTGRPDDMHFEIHASADDVADMAAKIKGEDVSPEELLDYDNVPNLYSDKGTNPNVTVRTALKAAVSADVTVRDVAAAVAILRGDVQSIEAKIDALIAALPAR